MTALEKIPPSQLAAIRDRALAEKCRRSFYAFVKAAWPIVEPSAPLLDSWHVKAICDHLQEIARGGIKRLLINVPPGHAKSLLVSVLFPAWQWTHSPGWRAIFATYAAPLTLRDSIKCRSLIESSWYQEAFAEPGAWRLSDYQNAKSYFANTRRGERLATSTGGMSTGFRGDAIVIDDPISAQDAMSKLEREKITFWFDKAMSSRLNDLSKGAIVIIMQRLHEDDLSGHVLRAGGYEHLCLPSEFEPKRRSVTFRTVGGVRSELWRDPRTEAGDLLFPALFPRAVLDTAKSSRGMGADAYAGQHDQTPVAQEGGMFKRQWWRFYKRDGGGVALRPRGCSDMVPIDLPKLDRIVISLDATFKDSKSSDFVSFTVWGAAGSQRFLLDRINERLGFTATIARFRALVARWPKAHAKLVEDKANGSAIIDTLRTELSGIIAIQPDGGKESRAWAIQPAVQAGDVYLPDGEEWLSDFIDQFATFPRGTHDDEVDSTTQALRYLAPSGDAARARALTEIGDTSAFGRAVATMRLGVR